MLQPARAVRSGQTLVALLVVIIILLVLYLLFLQGGKILGGGQKQRSLPTQAMEKGKETACIQYVRQIRQAIQMHTTVEDTKPASLAELKLPAEMLRCPVGGEPYQYNPQAGAVWCPHPGHQQF